MEIIKREYKVYTFDELTEEAQDRAIEKQADINVDYEWWDSIEDDAEQIGLSIIEFNTYHRTVKGKLLNDAIDVAEAIIRNHGEDCDTYKLAKQYIEDYEALPQDEDGWRDSEEIDEEFEYALSQEYLSMLIKDYEYLTSREAIIETIVANDYRFTEDGNLFS